ncbi:MAG: hypothetical protein V1802_03385 [Candidatus Aenigmatarchaeota archaeon]
MKTLYVFQTTESPEFLMDPRTSINWDENLGKCKKQGAQFLGKIRAYHPEADYPYLVLLRTDDNPRLCLIRPDSESLGGQQGGLATWSEEYDASTIEGLARMIHEELSRPKNKWRHLNPITCVIDFTNDYDVPLEAYELLKTQHKYDVRKIEL